MEVEGDSGLEIHILAKSQGLEEAEDMSQPIRKARFWDQQAQCPPHFLGLKMKLHALVL